jgi:transposase
MCFVDAMRGQGGPTNGKGDSAGRFMGFDRADSSAPATTLSISRTQAGRPSQNAHRNPFRSANRYPLGGLAPGNGLWIGHDLLETTPRLAAGRCVDRSPPRPAQPSTTVRQDRLVAGSGGQLQRAGCFWGVKTGPNPTDRAKSGSKHHIITDANGIPLAATLTAANVADVTQLLPLVDAIPPVQGKRGRPRKRPCSLFADKAYDSMAHRLLLCIRGIEPIIPKRRTDEQPGLGAVRWVVERTLSWLHQYRRLRVRYERRDDIHEAFMILGCIHICYKCLKGSFC